MTDTEKHAQYFLIVLNGLFKKQCFLSAISFYYLTKWNLAFSPPLFNFECSLEWKSYKQSNKENLNGNFHIHRERVSLYPLTFSDPGQIGIWGG